jgi:hypothetical protein
MNFRAFSRMQIAISVTSIALIFAVAPPQSKAAAARSGQVTRVMLFSLKRPGNVDDQNFLLRGLRALRRVRGVDDVRVGRSLKADRPAAEQFFDLGAILIFRDREAFNKFERDPRRGPAIDAMLQPLVRRYTVYNLVNE